MRNKTRPLPWAELPPIDHLRTPLESVIPKTSATAPGTKPKVSKQGAHPKDTRGSSRVRLSVQPTGDRKRKTLWGPDSSSDDESHRGRSQDRQGSKRVKVGLQPQQEDDPNASGEDEVSY